MRFCPICGKRGIKGDFCEECKPPETELNFKEIIVKYCIECGKYLTGNKWKPSKTIDEAVISVAKEKIKNPQRFLMTIEPDTSELEAKPGIQREINLVVRVKEDEFIIPARVEMTYCPKCGKKGSQYFEGKLQLRDVSEDVKKFVEDELEKATIKGIFVNDYQELKNGTDYYITDKKFIRRLGKELKKRFEGELKESPQLFSHNSQTSKDIYRLNVLFRQKN